MTASCPECGEDALRGDGTCASCGASVADRGSGGQDGDAVEVDAAPGETGGRDSSPGGSSSDPPSAVAARRARDTGRRGGETRDEQAAGDGSTPEPDQTEADSPAGGRGGAQESGRGNRGRRRAERNTGHGAVGARKEKYGRTAGRDRAASTAEPADSRDTASTAEPADSRDSASTDPTATPKQPGWSAEALVGSDVLSAVSVDEPEDVLELVAFPTAVVLYLVAMRSLLWGAVGLLVGDTGPFAVGLVAVAGSLGAIYVDVSHLGEEFGETTALEWVISSVLVYPGVVAIYIFHRLRYTLRAQGSPSLAPE